MDARGVGRVVDRRRVDRRHVDPQQPRIGEARNVSLLPCPHLRSDRRQLGPLQARPRAHHRNEQRLRIGGDVPCERVLPVAQIDRVRVRIGRLQPIVVAAAAEDRDVRLLRRQRVDGMGVDPHVGVRSDGTRHHGARLRQVPDRHRLEPQPHQLQEPVAHVARAGARRLAHDTVADEAEGAAHRHQARRQRREGQAPRGEHGAREEGWGGHQSRSTSSATVNVSDAAGV